MIFTVKDEYIEIFENNKKYSVTWNHVFIMTRQTMFMNIFEKRINHTLVMALSNTKRDRAIVSLFDTEFVVGTEYMNIESEIIMKCIKVVDGIGTFRPVKKRNKTTTLNLYTSEDVMLWKIYRVK